MDEINGRHCPVCALHLSFHAVQHGEAQRENSARRRAKRRIEQDEGYCILSDSVDYLCKLNPVHTLGAGMFTDIVLTALDRWCPVACQEHLHHTVIYLRPCAGVKYPSQGTTALQHSCGDNDGQAESRKRNDDTGDIALYALCALASGGLPSKCSHFHSRSTSFVRICSPTA